MRTARPVVMIALASAIALSAVTVAANWLQKKDAMNTIKVVVASRDLPMGTRLQPAMLETVDWPRAAPIQLPLERTEQAYDRVINMPVLRGEPILQNKLAALGEKGGLSSVLKDGKRAVTVKVNEVVGVAGFALPGNFVDVMVNIADTDNNPVSKIVLERIQVLAVAQDVASTENKPRVVSAVTLEVTPQEAERLDLARNIGALSLVLRSQVDLLSVQTQGSRKADLLKETAFPVSGSHVANVLSGKAGSRLTPSILARQSTTRVQAAEVPTLEVIRGVKKTHEITNDLQK